MHHWLFGLTTRAAVLLQPPFPYLGGYDKTDNCDHEKGHDLLDVQISAQSLEGYGGCYGNGNDKSDDDPQPGRVDRNGVTPRVEQGVQDGDIIVEFGEPKVSEMRTIQRL